MAKVTIQKRGVVSLGKDLIEQAGVDEGDRFEAIVDDDGNIVLKPLFEIPRDQMWFWTEKWQKEMMQARQEEQDGEADDVMSLDELFQDLNNENEE